MVVGLGQTGISVIEFLQAQNAHWCAVDTRQDPPDLAALQQRFPKQKIESGPLTIEQFKDVDSIILSPGISPHEPVLATLQQKGIPIIGDIELFARFHQGRTIGITGSNAKSTVTTLVAQMVETAGASMRMGGNIGIPALSLLPDTEDITHVLELSSFQLDTTQSLRLEVASILNISEDHLDRYETMEAYIAAKQQIYRQARFIVVNRDDINTYPKEGQPIHTSFGLSTPKENEFGLIIQDQETYLAYGEELLLNVSEMPLQGRHNWSNALAALAIGHCLELPWHAMVSVLRTFKGLPHRCQIVTRKNDVVWYNDSKGTNVGATLAAIAGLHIPNQKQLILIAGGIGKGADFSPLREAIEESVKLTILFGQDKAIIKQALTGNSEIIEVADLPAAITLANQRAKAGDIVLFSPACASFDMFQNYAHRGELYCKWVLDLN